MMPLFEFECNSCSNVIETIEPFVKSEERHRCPKCGRMMKKVVGNKMTFKLLYDPKKDIVTWSNEGFATTQRFRETNKLAKHNIFPMPVKKDK